MAEIAIGLGAKALSAALPMLISKIKKIADRRKKASSEMKGKIAILNFSGHPLSDDCSKKLNELIPGEVINIPIPNVDEKNIIEIAIQLIEEAAKQGAANNLLTGEYAIIPSGLSPLFSVILTILHGISGHFPRIIPLWREGGIFIPKGIIDLQDLRSQMRTQRF